MSPNKDSQRNCEINTNTVKSGNYCLCFSYFYSNKKT